MLTKEATVKASRLFANLYHYISEINFALNLHSLNGKNKLKKQGLINKGKHLDQGKHQASFYLFVTGLKSHAKVATFLLCR